ncbi:MAG: hypothetical protein QM775_08705 [Pirellulales bacterium]
MNIYVIQPILDNPAFDGLEISQHAEHLETWPDDWRVNYKTWMPKSMRADWPVPAAAGNVRRYNDYPCINLSYPAFSQRAVDLLRDILELNGELLPVRHQLGTYYYFNCTTMTNGVDLEQSHITRTSDGGLVTSTKKLVFVDEVVKSLTIFKVRTQLMEVFVTQTFVDRVESAGLQGFSFVPIWPLPDGSTYFDEMYRVGKKAEKLRPNDLSSIDVNANTLVLRLLTARRKASASELKSLEIVMQYLEGRLYHPDEGLDDYIGNVEGHDVLDGEIRIFLSTPSVDRLVDAIRPHLKALPWNGKIYVVKRRGELFDSGATEEYVNID